MDSQRPKRIPKDGTYPARVLCEECDSYVSEVLFYVHQGSKTCARTRQEKLNPKPARQKRRFGLLQDGSIREHDSPTLVD